MALDLFFEKKYKMTPIMGILHGTIVDAATGEALSAKVHVLTASGQFTHRLVTGKCR